MSSHLPDPLEFGVIFENHYAHEKCGTDWSDTWDCAVNDDCPKCGAEIEPYESIICDPETGEPIPDQDRDLVSAYDQQGNIKQWETA